MFSETGIEGSDQETKDTLTKVELRILVSVCLVVVGVFIWRWL